MGIFQRIVDTIQYIRLHGWAEFREARKRYDTHARLQEYGEARFNKKNYIKQIQLAKKRK